MCFVGLSWRTCIASIQKAWQGGHWKHKSQGLWGDHVQIKKLSSHTLCERKSGDSKYYSNPWGRNKWSRSLYASEYMLGSYIKSWWNWALVSNISIECFILFRLQWVEVIDRSAMLTSLLLYHCWITWNWFRSYT